MGNIDYPEYLHSMSGADLYRQIRTHAPVRTKNPLIHIPKLTIQRRLLENNRKSTPHFDANYYLSVYRSLQVIFIY